MEDIKLSSNITYFYKYVVPTFFVLILLILLVSIFIDFIKIELSIRIVLVFLDFMFCLFMIPLMKLHFISYNEKHTIVRGYKLVKKVPNKDVIKVKRFMFYFYRLFYFEGDKLKKVIFLPKIIRTFIHFFGKPKYLKKYELDIKQ